MEQLHLRSDTEVLEWNRSGLHPSKTMDVREDCEVWQLNFKLLLLQRSRKVGNQERNY